MFDLTGFDIVEHSPCYNRLILKIVPSTGGCELDIDQRVMRHHHQDKMNNNRAGIVECGGGGGSESLSAFNNSLCSINSSRSSNVGGDRDNKVLFIGFEESWERDLWSAWLIQVHINMFYYLFINKFNVNDH